MKLKFIKFLMIPLIAQVMLIYPSFVENSQNPKSKTSLITQIQELSQSLGHCTYQDRTALDKKNISELHIIIAGLQAVHQTAYQDTI